MERGHWHKFNTNSDRTERVCRVCGVVQIKIHGRWFEVKDKDGRTISPPGQQ